MAVERCRIGLYTTVGSRCVQTSSGLEYSILFADSQIPDADVRIERSVLGREGIIRRDKARPRTQKFILGDQSVISLPLTDE